MLVFVVPALLMALLYWILIDTPLFGRIAHAIFALFPFLVMFMVASITTLRERRSGTLERTLTMPVSRGAFIAGYALAFSLLSLVQTLITVGVCVAWLGVEVDGSLGTFFGIALLDALVGTAAGLTSSAFARTEFQIVQFGVKGQKVCLAPACRGVRFGLFGCRLSGCTRYRYRCRRGLVVLFRGRLGSRCGSGV